MTETVETPLLSATGVSKIYPNPAHRLRILWHALIRPSKPYTIGRRVLEDINIEVRPGETLGLIGRNGAGKSTLLSILAGLVAPTFGKITTRGSVAVLLGSGIAFNSELSGRENARAYCRLNGIPQRALDLRLKEIEDFAELGDYFDVPVGAYSSGMQARLSFACAMAKHADVLIIDEVLAVGDAEFRAKCLDYIKERQTSGQTYVLVSHSAGVVANFCTRVCLLDQGKVIYLGEPRIALERYKQLQVDSRQTEYKTTLSTVSNSGGSIDPHSLNVHPDKIDFTFSVASSIASEQYILRFQVKNDKGIAITSYEMPQEAAFKMEKGQSKTFSYSFRNLLRPGRYWINIVLVRLEEDDTQVVCISPTAFKLDVIGPAVGGIVDLEFRPMDETEATPQAPARQYLEG